MKRSWYSRMLFSYFPVFLLVVTVLIFLAFMVITELSRSETEKANYISTSYVADTVERTLNDVELGVLQEIGKIILIMTSWMRPPAQTHRLAARMKLCRA